MSSSTFWAKYALNAGLAVSVEKPAGINSKEVEEVRALAEKKGLMNSKTAY